MKSLIITLAAIAGVLIFGTTVYAQPGTPGDPLVSRSYLESRIAELEARINQLMLEIEMLAPIEISEISPDVFPPGIPTPPTQFPIDPRPGAIFQVVRAEPGSTLFGGASTEIILRAGDATIVSGPNGLANVTTGVDLMNGQAVPLNHLLIVPQDDGRGLHFHTVAYLMVKGHYTVGW